MANIIRYRTGSLLDTLQNELNSIFRDSGESSEYTGWNPSVDVLTKPDKYVVHVDIPGVDPKDIQVHMDGDLLTIEGERKVDLKDDGDGYTRTERFRGKFSRSFTLPSDVVEEDIDATSSNGVLTLVIPKVEKKQVRKIEVKSDT